MISDKNIIIMLSAALVLLSILMALVLQRSALLSVAGSLASTPSGSASPNGLMNALTDSGVPSVSAPSGFVSPNGLMSTLSGRISAVGSGSFTIDPTAQGKTPQSAITVMITKDTVITLQTQKSPQVMAQEMLAYQKQSSTTQGVNGTGMVANPPLPFTSKTVSLADIAAGMYANITPVTDSKQDATTVVAQSVTIFVIPSLPAVPTQPPTTPVKSN